MLVEQERLGCGVGASMVQTAAKFGHERCFIWQFHQLHGACNRFCRAVHLLRLSQLSLCGKDNLKWVNIAIKVSLEAHNLLQDAWPDEGVGQVRTHYEKKHYKNHALWVKWILSAR